MEERSNSSLEMFWMKGNTPRYEKKKSSYPDLLTSQSWSDWFESYLSCCSQILSRWMVISLILIPNAHPWGKIWTLILNNGQIELKSVWTTCVSLRLQWTGWYLFNLQTRFILLNWIGLHPKTCPKNLLFSTFIWVTARKQFSKYISSRLKGKWYTVQQAVQSIKNA